MTEALRPVLPLSPVAHRAEIGEGGEDAVFIDEFARPPLTRFKTELARGVSAGHAANVVHIAAHKGHARGYFIRLGDYAVFVQIARHVAENKPAYFTSAV